MKATPSSRDVVRRVVAIAGGYTATRLRVLERLPGNPLGVAINASGNLLALAARHLPVPDFNSVVGLRAGQADQIAPLVDWYRDQHVSPRFEIVPGEDDPAIGRELVRRGFLPDGSHTALIGDAAVDPAPDPPIERVMDATGMEAFLASYVAGWDIPASVQAGFKRNVAAWIDEPGWTLYLARVCGVPAATAILYVHDDIGYLADGATDPNFRRRGLHTALLRRRIKDARAAGVDFVCAGAQFLSTSHRNMERVGLRVLFQRTTWTPARSENEAVPVDASD